MNVPIRIHQHPLKQALHLTPEFAKKKLANYSVNVGLKCSHDCTYCSSGAVLRCHKGFPTVGENPFEHGYAIVDPDIPEKLAKEIKGKRTRGIVQLCTTVDAWCPAAQQHNLGRRCLEVLLAEPGWTVRILTKNAAVTREYDLIGQYRDRVLVGLSLTGTTDKEDVLAVIEPNASPISQRMEALRNAHAKGLRTYGQLCPLLPGVSNTPDQLETLVGFLEECGVEEVFAEAVNQRGPGLKDTEEALRQAGKDTEEALRQARFVSAAEAVAGIRRADKWSVYVADLLRDLQAALRNHGMIDKLRFLLYPSKLQSADRARIEADAAGVVWL